MAHYEEDWDRDDYGGDQDDYSNHTIEDEEIISVADDMKAEQDSQQRSSSSDQEDQGSTIENEGSKQAYIDLLDDQPAFSISNETRITNPYLSKYQKAIILGKRAQQISNNSPIYTNTDLDTLKKMNPLQIAEKQFSQNRIPFIIRRHLPNGQFEDWKLQQLKR